MKRIYLATAVMAMAVGVVSLLGIDNRTEREKALDENVEALATGENSECDYKNGYTAFGNQSGGGYDCCMNWRNMQPSGTMCR